MKPRKIRRTHTYRRRSPFRRRSAFPWKGVLTVVLCLALAAGGFFTLKWIVERPLSQDGPTASGTGATTTAPTTGTTQPTQPPLPVMPTAQNARGFYVPTAALADLTVLEEQMDAALKAGFNAIVFDLKDIDGYVWYQTGVVGAQQAQSVKEGALTLEQLQAVLALCRQKGVLPLPRVYAFHDHVASDTDSKNHIPGANVMWVQNPAYTWHDWYVDKGGQTWLNPAAEAAQKYILDLLTELKDLGFTAMMVDGVQFPDKRAEAYYGNGIDSTVTPSVLAAFVERVEQTLGETEVVFCMPAAASIGVNTGAFGDNPLTFGAAIASPLVLPSSMDGRLTVGSTVIANPAADPVKTTQAVYEQLRARVGLMENGAPALLPWIEASGTAAQVKTILQTVAADKTAPVILYSATGNYDFAGYTG